MDQTRRRIIAAASLAPIALLGARQAFAQDKPVCHDPAKTTLGQRNMRKSVGYVDPSPHTDKRCGGCAFFVATQNGCGTCQIFSGGPVAATAFCNSYAPKAA